MDYNTNSLSLTDIENLYEVGFETSLEQPKISKVQQVAQNFIRILLTTPGTDKYNRNLGAGLYNYLKYANIDPDDPFYKLEITRRISLAKEQMKEFEKTDFPPLSESLSDAYLNDIFYDDDDVLIIQIRLLTMDGNSLDIAIPPERWD